MLRPCFDEPYTAGMTSRAAACPGGLCLQERRSHRGELNPGSNTLRADAADLTRGSQRAGVVMLGKPPLFPSSYAPLFALVAIRKHAPFLQ